MIDRPVRMIPKMVGQDVPSILFCPVCSECGAVIMREVDYEEIPDYLQAVHDVRLPYKEKQIYPAMCPKCGVPFEAIKMYTKLPFKGY